MSPTSSTRTSAEATKSAATVPAVDARRGDDALPDPSSTAPLLEVTDLKVSFPSEDGRVNAVRGVNLSVARGEVLALVGESGSGSPSPRRRSWACSTSPPSHRLGSPPRH